MSDQPDAPEPDALQPWQDAALSADYRWHLLCQARTPLEQASAMMMLANSMSDLRTFLPGYDYNHDTLPWQRDEES